ncbi:MAG: hypothetical protein Q4B79_00170 [Moraxella sp.]|nr:hypothetical protein [Moraxella sp.]
MQWFIYKALNNCFILLILALLTACTGQQMKSLCESTGGKWGSVKSKCYRPSCIQNGTCKDWDWANSSDYCPKLKLGMDKPTVVFWLGNPKEQNYHSQNTLTWLAHKAEIEQVNATFVNDKLTKFECPHHAGHISLK